MNETYESRWTKHLIPRKRAGQQRMHHMEFALEKHYVKESGRKVSEIMRDAVCAAIAGVTLEEIQTLEISTQRAQDDISVMLADLKGNTTEHTAFMREIAKLKKAAAKEFFMSVLTDVMDRLTELIQQQREIRGVILSQLRELAEVHG